MPPPYPVFKYSKTAFSLQKTFVSYTSTPVIGGIAFVTHVLRSSCSCQTERHTCLSGCWKGRPEPRPASPSAGCLMRGFSPTAAFLTRTEAQARSGEGVACPLEPESPCSRPSDLCPQACRPSSAECTEGTVPGLSGSYKPQPKRSY